MKLHTVSRRKTLTMNIIMSLAASVVGAYTVMCVYWLVTGMRYGLRNCMGIWLGSYLLMFTVLLIVSFYFCYDRRKRITAMAEHSRIHGCDEEYFRMLGDYLGDELNESQSLIFASCCLASGQYKDCRTALQKVDFKSLTSSEQEEYFNICLYSAILDDEIELANNIYIKARHYFDRAVMNRHNEAVLHTLGMLCYVNGRLENAYRLFRSAMRRADDSLMCECSIGVGLVYLASGDKEGAKEMCFVAAELAQTRSHALRLKELMMKVENAYRAQNTRNIQ